MRPSDRALAVRVWMRALAVLVRVCVHVNEGDTPASQGFNCNRP